MVNSQLRTFMRTSITLTFCIIFLVVAVISTLSFTLPLATTHYLKGKGVNITIDKMSVNVINGRVAISQLTIVDIDSAKALTLDELLIDIDLSKAILERTLHAQKITVRNLFIPASSTSKGEQLTIAGINLERFKSEQEEETASTKPSSPWQIAWHQIALHDIAVTHTNIDTDTMVAFSLTHLNLDDYSPPRNDFNFNVILRASVRGIELNTRGEITTLPTGVTGTFNLNLARLAFDDIHQLSNHVAARLPASVLNTEGEFSSRARLSFSFDDNIELTFNDFSLSGKNIIYQLDSDQSIFSTLNLKISSMNIDVNEKAFSLTNLATTDTHVRYQASNHSPITQLDISNIVATIDHLDNKASDAASNVSLNMKIGEHGFISALSALLVNDPERQTTLNLHGEQINLTEFSGLAATYIDRVISKGALDFDAQLQIDNKQIESKAIFNMHQLSFKNVAKNTANAVGDERSTQDFQANKFDVQLGIPLNTALNLLRDKNDSIRLSIPVTGSTDNPEVHLSNIVNTAVLNAIKTAALTQLGPLMAITALEKLNDLKNASTLKPAYFEANSLTLDTEGENTLNKLADFLVKKDRLYVNVCGVANANENLTAINAAPSPKIFTGNLTTEKNMKNGSMPNSLSDLANARANLAKNYLMQQGVDGKRLIICAATIEQNETARPRVDFSI